MANMSSRPQVAYKFGGFLLNPADKQLLHDGRAVALPPKVFDTLLLLVESHARLVEKDDFLKRVWPDSFVEEVALAHCISHLRKALRNGTQGRTFIETVPKRGYKFVAAVYLADGFTEEMIAALGQIDHDRLSVVGRTSMTAYKRTAKSLTDIGRELDVAYLIESSVRAEGGRLRIMSKLIRARDQVQIWSASYDSEPSSILEFQCKLSAAIAEQIRLRLSPERLTALARRQTRNAEAYDLYLRGRYFWHQLSPPTTRRAVECYARATELDPEYALAWSGLADCYAGSPINGDAPPLEVWPRARYADTVLKDGDKVEIVRPMGGG